MQKITTLAAVAAVSFAGAASAVPIASTGFEGTVGELGIASETFLSGPGPSPRVGVVAEDPRTDSNSYVISDTDGDYEILFNPVDVSLYENVSVDAWWLSEAPSGNLSGSDTLIIEALWNDGGADTTVTLFDGSGNNGVALENGLDQYNLATGVIPDIATSVQIRIVGNTSVGGNTADSGEELHLDDISINGDFIPEPTSAALALGALSLLTRRRRH